MDFAPLLFDRRGWSNERTRAIHAIWRSSKELDQILLITEGNESCSSLAVVLRNTLSETQTKTQVLSNCWEKFLLIYVVIKTFIVLRKSFIIVCSTIAHARIRKLGFLKCITANQQTGKSLREQPHLGRNLLFILPRVRHLQQCALH